MPLKRYMPQVTANRFEIILDREGASGQRGSVRHEYFLSSYVRIELLAPGSHVYPHKLYLKIKMWSFFIFF